MKDNGETRWHGTRQTKPSRLTTPHNGQNASLSCAAPATAPQHVRAWRISWTPLATANFTPVTTISYTRSAYNRIPAQRPRAATTEES